MNKTDNSFESWCIIELMGHNAIAGLVTEATIGGHTFLRVDVPAHEGQDAYTQYLGNGSIYRMTPTGKAEVMVALNHILPRPIDLYLLPGVEQPERDPYPGDDDDDD